MNERWRRLIDLGACEHGRVSPVYCSECIALVEAEMARDQEREELEELARALQ